MSESFEYKPIGERTNSRLTNQTVDRLGYQYLVLYGLLTDLIAKVNVLEERVEKLENTPKRAPRKPKQED